ncbi:hypothetical protein GTZ99_09905 [Novosphingobium sp. FSY-8]|uniref:Uncharacterized protein n=1 Tax=Novosphingobium ovatum TaxID=1908523 RepID=A0ABW9XEC9_9SPHN|nr:hypothetical protein [Novosphingobium ovatum]NBC36870.1 hypothetical protein [Novosphingobium ovatum]
MIAPDRHDPCGLHGADHGPRAPQGGRAWRIWRAGAVTGLMALGLLAMGQHLSAQPAASDAPRIVALPLSPLDDGPTTGPSIAKAGAKPTPNPTQKPAPKPTSQARAESKPKPAPSASPAPRAGAEKAPPHRAEGKSAPHPIASDATARPAHDAPRPTPRPDAASHTPLARTPPASSASAASAAGAALGQRLQHRPADGLSWQAGLDMAKDLAVTLGLAVMAAAALLGWVLARALMARRRADSPATPPATMPDEGEDAHAGEDAPILPGPARKPLSAADDARDNASDGPVPRPARFAPFADAPFTPGLPFAEVEEPIPDLSSLTAPAPAPIPVAPAAQDGTPSRTAAPMLNATLEALRFSTTLSNATLRYRLRLHHAGAADLGPVVVRMALGAGDDSLDAGDGALDADGLPPAPPWLAVAHEGDELAAGADVEWTGQLRVSLKRLNSGPLAGSGLALPMVWVEVQAARIAGESGDKGERPPPVTLHRGWLIGEGEPDSAPEPTPSAITPLRLDQGPITIMSPRAWPVAR